MDTEATPGEPEAEFATACETRPGRTVVIENGNPNGWIATNLTVDVER